MSADEGAPAGTTPTESLGPSARVRALLASVAVAAIVILIVFEVPLLHPILATPLGFLDLVALVAALAYILAYHAIDRRGSKRRAA